MGSPTHKKIYNKIIWIKSKCQLARLLEPYCLGETTIEKEPVKRAKQMRVSEHSIIEEDYHLKMLLTFGGAIAHAIFRIL